MSKCLMIQGTSSDAGKSLLVSGLCRLYSNRGYKVTPFKSQNMSLHSYTTKEGAEIAIAQVTQAKAARINPTADMNPVLLKPNGKYSSQVVIHGKTVGKKDFSKKEEDNKSDDTNNTDKEIVNKNNNTHNTNNKEIAKKAIEESLNRLKEEYDIIIMEGAGSPAEINLREGDLANMGVAEIADANVLLVGDIDKGGVFASIAGTFLLLDDEDTQRFKGVIINKFRGNPDLLKSGTDKLEEIINVPVLGIIPYTSGLTLPKEDSSSIKDYFNNINNLDKNYKKLDDKKIIIGVLNLENISNYTELDPLAVEKDVEIRLIDINEYTSLDGFDAIIIPDTIKPKEDARILIENNITTKIKEVYDNINIVGLCSGYEVLKIVLDEENNPKIIEENPKIIGNDKHSAFYNFEIRKEFLNKLRVEKNLNENYEDVYGKMVDDSLNKLANTIGENLNIEYIDKLIFDN